MKVGDLFRCIVGGIDRGFMNVLGRLPIEKGGKRKWMLKKSENWRNRREILKRRNFDGRISTIPNYGGDNFLKTSGRQLWGDEVGIKSVEAG